MNKDYVSFSRFTWIIGLLVSAFVVVNGFLWSELKEVRGEVNAYKDATFIKISALQRETTEIKSDVKWIVKLLNQFDLGTE